MEDFIFETNSLIFIKSGERCSANSLEEVIEQIDPESFAILIRTGCDYRSVKIKLNNLFGKHYNISMEPDYSLLEELDYEDRSIMNSGPYSGRGSLENIFSISFDLKRSTKHTPLSALNLALFLMSVVYILDMCPARDVGGILMDDFFRYSELKNVKYLNENKILYPDLIKYVKAVKSKSGDSSVYNLRTTFSSSIFSGVSVVIQNEQELISCLNSCETDRNDIWEKLAKRYQTLRRSL